MSCSAEADHIEMYFYQDSIFAGCCLFFVQAMIWASGTIRSGPPASPTGVVIMDNTVAYVDIHVFGHQTSRTRPLEAARAASSTTIVCQYHQKTMENNENH